MALGLAQAWTLLGDETAAAPYLAAARRHDAMLSLLRGRAELGAS